MSQLQGIVSQYLPGLSTAGGSGKRAAPRVDRASMRAQLEAYSRQNLFWFSVCFAAVVIVFGLAIWLVLRLRDDPGQLTAVTAASGISVMGAVTLLVSMWTRKNKADMLATLVPSLDDDALRAVCETLLKQL